MKAKKKFIHRLAAAACALIVGVSCLFGSVPYFASGGSNSENIEKYIAEIGLSVPELPEGYKFVFVEFVNASDTDYAIYGLSTADVGKRNCEVCSVLRCVNGKRSFNFVSRNYFNKITGISYSDYSDDSVGKYCVLGFDNGKWKDVNVVDSDNFWQGSVGDNRVLYSDFDVYYGCSTNGSCSVCGHSLDGQLAYDSKHDGVGGGGEYNGKIGYLQNISYRKLWETGKVTYYYDDSSRTDMWSFDSLTTTGVDLTAGNYSIRHYIQPCLVTGYEEEDIVEEYDKYFMGEYDAADLSFRYKRADYDEALEEAGFEGLGFWDSLIGRFILEHQYFQIVNNDTGEVGGYVVLRPNDADKNSFGVEYLGKTVTTDGELDLENGYDDTIIDYSSGSGSTLEEAIVNSNEPSFDSLAGVESFTNSLNSFSESLENVPLALKSIINLFPWWVLASLGLSFVFAFVLMLYKVFR